MKKKLFGVLACVLTLMILCTMFAFAEESGDDGKVWDFWSLLSLQNLDVIQLLSVLITTIVTFFRMIGGKGALKEMWELLLKALKNMIPSK